MLISEIYKSKQGEGLLTGVPSVFVRTSGCNLRCHFCDTPFTSWNPSGQPMAVASIVEKVKSVAHDSLPPIIDCDPSDVSMVPDEDRINVAKHVVLTGGEPMLSPEVTELCDAIKDEGFHITIETAGTIIRNVQCDLMSISPKLNNSTPSPDRLSHDQLKRVGEWQKKHEATRHRPDLVKSLIEEREYYQLKFVVKEEADLAEIESYVDEVNQLMAGQSLERTNVLLMPEGVDQETLLSRESWLEQKCKALGFSFCPRMHIQWYGNRRAT